MDPVQMWAFEDQFRRLSTRLHEENHFPNERLGRHVAYVEGLAQIFDGLMREDAAMVRYGFAGINAALNTLEAN